jgi:chemotaxis protein CheD
MAMASPNPHPLDVARGPSKVTRNAPALGEHQRAFLLPGQLHVSAEPFQVRTILGSCVSICLWDKRQRAGGMNHFLLPASREGEPASLRFADVATYTLLEKLRALGCRPPNLRAKIFGGSSMFRNQNRYATSLGARNVTVALELMKNAGIPVSVQDTGGSQGRKIVFNTDDGVAWSQRI